MGKGKEHDPFKLKTRQNGHEELNLNFKEIALLATQHSGVLVDVNHRVT